MSPAGTRIVYLQSMRVAIPHWQGRVSPVFDVAANLLLVEVAETREVERQEVTLTASDPGRRARQVAQFSPDVLICGAVSRDLELALRSAGIQVIPEICGQVDEVMRSFLLGDLVGNAFRMPGCCGRRRFRGGLQASPSREDACGHTGEQRTGRMRRNRRGQ